MAHTYVYCDGLFIEAIRLAFYRLMGNRSHTACINQIDMTFDLQRSRYLYTALLGDLRVPPNRPEFLRTVLFHLPQEHGYDVVKIAHELYRVVWREPQERRRAADTNAFFEAVAVAQKIVGAS